jgi:hypothetical protein
VGLKVAPPLTLLAVLALTVFWGRSLIDLAAFDFLVFFLFISSSLSSCQLSSVPAAIASNLGASESAVSEPAALRELNRESRSAAAMFD